MVKRTFYLVFVTFMMLYIIQPAFAGFNIEVVNESNIVYDVDLVITSVGFNAMYGRISLREVGANQTKSFPCQFKYGEIPLAGIAMPLSLEGCNLNMMVVASPKQASKNLLLSNFKDIIQPPQRIEMITEEEPRTFPSQPALKGIRPPSPIKIIIKGQGDEYSSDIIEAEVNGHKLLQVVDDD